MIYRVQHNKENPYFMLNRAGVNDERLSFKAVGILTYLLSKPDNWTVLEADLVKRHTEGDTAIRSGLKELRDFGYLEKVSVRDAATQRITGWETHVHETPQEDVEPVVLETETHNVENPPSGNSTLWEDTPLMIIDSLVSKEEKEHALPNEEKAVTPASTPFLVDGMTAGELTRQRAVAHKYCPEYDWKIHRAIFDFLVTLLGKQKLVDVDHDRTISDLQGAAVTLEKLGFTVDGLSDLQDAWKADWRGKKGSNVNQFVEFVSEHKPGVGGGVSQAVLSFSMEV